MKLELATVERLNLGLSAGAVAASYAFLTPHFATSLAAGACLEAINLGAIHRGARKLFGGDLAELGEGLSGAYRVVWQTIVAMYEQGDGAP